MDSRGRKVPLHPSWAVNRGIIFNGTTASKPTARSATTSPLSDLGDSFAFSCSGSENFLSGDAYFRRQSTQASLADLRRNRHIRPHESRPVHPAAPTNSMPRSLLNHIPPTNTEKVLPVYSAYKVLDAKQISSDFHSQCLNYGRRLLATAIGQQVLLFNPDDLASYGTCKLDWPLDPNNSVLQPCRTPSAVWVSHYSDNTVFVGDADGGTSVLSLPEGTNAMTRVSGHYDGASPASAHCITSSPHQPHVFIGGFGDGCVKIFDVRKPNLLASRTIVPTPQPLAGVARRNISLDINCSGGLLAVGTSHGAVQVYPLGMAFQKPILEYVYPEWSAAKAIAFHPSRPHELTVGGGSGDGAIRTIDVHLGQLTAMVRTRSQITQIAYSADGCHIVSTHGYEVKAQTKPSGMGEWAATGRTHHRSISDRHSYAYPEDMGERSITSPIDVMPQEVSATQQAHPSSFANPRLPVPSASNVATVPASALYLIPANSVCVWSRGKGTMENRMGGAGDDASPLTHAGRSTLRRVQSAYSITRSGYGEDEEALMSNTNGRTSLRQLSAASASIASSLFGGQSTSGAGNFHDIDWSQNWRKETCLTQHSSRPLFLSRCRASTGQQAGVFATAAGGEDSSIRLWKLISAPNGLPSRTDHVTSNASSRSSSVSSLGLDDNSLR